jgi:hypothetical protein
MLCIAPPEKATDNTALEKDLRGKAASANGSTSNQSGAKLQVMLNVEAAWLAECPSFNLTSLLRWRSLRRHRCNIVEDRSTQELCLVSHIDVAHYVSPVNLDRLRAYLQFGRNLLVVQALRIQFHNLTFSRRQSGNANDINLARANHYGKAIVRLVHFRFCMAQRLK